MPTKMREIRRSGHGARSALLLVCISLLAILVVLSGCKGGNATDSNKYANENFRTGSDGVVMKWVEENTPDVIYDTAGAGPTPEIELMVELRNEGAEQTREGYVVLSGFDQNYIHLPFYTPGSGDGDGYDFDLEGRSLVNAQGGYKLLVIPPSSCSGEGCDCDGGWCDGSIHLPNSVEEYPVTFKLDACYRYTTIASPTVCVDPDPYKASQNKACEPGTVENLGGSQGGPVGVTSVDVENIPGWVIFNIKVENVGDGMVVDQSAVGSVRSPTPCPHQLRFNNMNMVDYRITFQNRDVTAECEPANGPLRLLSESGEIFCRVPVDGSAGSAFSSPLQIELMYGYTDSIERSVTIRRLIPE